MNCREFTSNLKFHHFSYSFASPIHIDVGQTRFKHIPKVFSPTVGHTKETIFVLIFLINCRHHSRCNNMRTTVKIIKSIMNVQ
jgi:hypothetical protein